MYMRGPSNIYGFDTSIGGHQEVGCITRSGRCYPKKTRAQEDESILQRSPIKKARRERHPCKDGVIITISNLFCEAAKHKEYANDLIALASVANLRCVNRLFHSRLSSVWSNLLQQLTYPQKIKLAYSAAEHGCFFTLLRTLDFQNDVHERIFYRIAKNNRHHYTDEKYRLLSLCEIEYHVKHYVIFDHKRSNKTINNIINKVMCEIKKLNQHYIDSLHSDAGVYIDLMFMEIHKGKSLSDAIMYVAKKASRTCRDDKPHTMHR